MTLSGSVITIISSLWTLTIYSKRLLEDIKNSEEQFNQLERKVKDFTALLERVDHTYKTDLQNLQYLQNLTISERVHEQTNREAVYDELRSYEKEFKEHEGDFSKFLLQKRDGRSRTTSFGTILLKAITYDKLQSIEKSILSHQNAIQVLTGLDHR